MLETLSLTYLINSFNSDAHSASQKVNNHEQRHRNRSNSSALICVYLPSSAVKKENVLTADDKGLTLIHADEKKRYMNNSDANRFDMTTQCVAGLLRVANWT